MNKHFDSMEIATLTSDYFYQDEFSMLRLQYLFIMDGLLDQANPLSIS